MIVAPMSYGFSVGPQFADFADRRWSQHEHVTHVYAMDDLLSVANWKSHLIAAARWCASNFRRANSSRAVVGIGVNQTLFGG